MKKFFIFLISTAISTALLFLLIELSVRLLFPEINHQDTQLSLFQERSFGQSIGWKPNAEGESFGENVSIDDQGFRKMRTPENFSSSWLVLGDSVTFGVGVKTEETFTQLLQNKLPEIKVWNTSVVGYSIHNYRDVLEHFIRQRNDIERVILFFCLNDIYGNITLKPNYSTIKDKTLSFLRRNSKLYMLLKNIFSDRSKVYTFRDTGLYSDNSKELHSSIELLDKMNAILKSISIDFLVIILPYEYQLREKEEKYLVPQKMLLSRLSNKQVRSLDAYKYFISKNGDSKKFYLYADAMHLSPHGHKVVFEFLQEELLN